MRGSYVAYMRMSIRAIRMNLPNTCGVESDTPENGLMFRNPLHHTTAWCHLPGSIWGFRSMRARKDSSSTPAQREVKTSHDRETLLHECAATQDRVTLAGQHPRRRGQCVRDNIHEDVDRRAREADRPASHGGGRDARRARRRARDGSKRNGGKIRP